MAWQSNISYANYIPTIQPIGDSLTQGTGASVQAAYRTAVYNSGVSAGIPQQIRFVGSQTAAGPTLTANPNHEGHSGYVVKPGAVQSLSDLTTTQTQPWDPDIAILFGGTNDLDPLVGNDSAATLAGYLATWLDVTYARFSRANQQIIVFNLLKRLDATDSKVVTYNALIGGVISGKAYASRVFLVDIYASIANPAIGVNMNDAVHPNDTGYPLVGAAIWASPQFQSAVSAARVVG